MDLLERAALDGRRHPWEVARARSFCRLLRHAGLSRDEARILDVGAGDAWIGRQILAQLPTGSEMVCWDVNYTEDDLQEIVPSNGVLLTADRPTGQFDGVLMLDVIEHVEDDLALVSGVVDELLVEGGWVLVSVPAYQRLFTSHDQLLRHYRRYSPAECRRVMTNAGLKIEAEGALFHSLLLIRVLQALKERTTKPRAEPCGIGAWSGGEVSTAVASWILDMENRLSLAASGALGKVLPGLSYWAICRRR